MGNRKKSGRMYSSSRRKSTNKIHVKRRVSSVQSVGSVNALDTVNVPLHTVIECTPFQDNETEVRSSEFPVVIKVEAAEISGVQRKPEVSEAILSQICVNGNRFTVSANIDSADGFATKSVTDADLAIDAEANHTDLAVSAKTEKHITEANIEGRRLCDMNFFIDEIHRTFDDHALKNNCRFGDWKVVNHVRRGFLTKLFFHCENCDHRDSIWSEQIGDGFVDANIGATVGTLTTGIGYAQLEEFSAAINVPCMSEKTYIKCRESLTSDLTKTAQDEMTLAGAAEKELAVQRGDIHNGIPWISVVVDGSWIKRSYGTNYDSLSGVGAIIGFNTGKVLFVGIRNKFCTVCDRAQRGGTEPKQHKCYKNFDRNASSTSMETDAIVEGFKSSLETHGLIYKLVVADGDSNVYKSIRDNDPYRDQGVQVRKIECTNHLLRNLCKKIKTTSEITQPKGQRKRGFVKARSAIEGKSLTIRKEVVQAAARWRDDKQPYHCRVKGLQSELLGICSHVFGEHKRCQNRACQDDRNRDEQNIVPELKAHGLYQRVSTAVEYISCFSDSLLFNLTNNVAESFNAIICKDIGGKRVNFGLRGSYNGRVAAAVVQFNTQKVLTNYHKSVCKKVPTVVKRLEKRRKMKVEKTKLARAEKGRKRTFRRSQGLDKHYGPNSQKPDVDVDVYELLCVNHFKKLSENAQNWEQIECDTREQSQSELWAALRKQMLTASNFGPVCRMRPTTSCAAKVKEILYPPISDAVALSYGLDYEDTARKEMAAKLKKEIRPSGLFVDQEFPFLGASPDGLIDEDGLVEIKCPFTAKDFTAQEAAEAFVHLKGVFDKKNPRVMNRSHRYFYQVQGQMHVSRRQYCIFVVWSPNYIKWIRVNRDDIFWDRQMKHLLVRFYNECMLPEILDSRFNRHMPIRNPVYITKAMEDAKQKKAHRDTGRTYKPLKRSVSETAVVMQTGKCTNISHKKDKGLGAEKAKAARFAAKEAVPEDHVHTKTTNAAFAPEIKNAAVIAHIGVKAAGFARGDANDKGFASEVATAYKKPQNRCVSKAIVTQEIEDCAIVGYQQGEGFTPEAAKSFRKTLDNKTNHVTSFRNNVLPIGSLLDDDSLDEFLRILRQKYKIETQSVEYMYSHPTLIEPIQSKRSIQIIGGKLINHWRCLYFDGARLRVYDSLPSLTNYKLINKEKEYIRLRYPTIREIDITFQKVQQQPPGVSCGIYAAAFATSVVFKRDPRKETYSKDETLMRRHFLRILESGTLSLFPQEES